MRARIAIACTVAALCGVATVPARAAPQVTFAKWTLQIVSAGVTTTETHPPGEAQPTCEDDQLEFAGIGGHYRRLKRGTVVRGRFLFDGTQVATAGPYSTQRTHGTFGLTWKPGGPVAIGGTHVLELRFVAAGKVIARVRQRFTPGDAGDCG